MRPGTLLNKTPLKRVPGNSLETLILEEDNRKWKIAYLGFHYPKQEKDNQINTDRKRTENENRCPSCSGNGQVDCSSCGYIFTTESLGMGRTRTTKTIDPDYRGNGKSICSTCHGRGYIFSKK